MNQDEITSTLSHLPLAEIRYFDSISSSNEEALTWAKSGAADYSLVITDTQTAGRGRLGRKWITNPDSALAFSIIIHPRPEEQRILPLFSPLGSLAVAETLSKRYGVDQVNIKWPNDVLIHEKKTAGILVETTWLGNSAQVAVIGIGVNVTPASVPPQDLLLFPATSVELEKGSPVNRIELLGNILSEIIAWREKITQSEFLQAWDQYLAFRGKNVHVQQTEHWSVTGELLGIDKYGNLRIRTELGGEFSVAFGDVQLRPAEKP
ncbi:MAG: biotin--[acetyl-CoA-carboxylase] ligase [Anaerolineae bacterium]|nr:biotin--[acetyl-CoA-carboxylase] ligase [Anaerolineae bacterium]